MNQNNLIDLFFSILRIDIFGGRSGEVPDEAKRFVKVGHGRLRPLPSRHRLPSGIQHQSQGFARGVEHVLQAIGVVFVMFGQCGFHLEQEPLHLVLQILQKSQVRLFRLQTLLVGRQFLEPHAHVSGMQHAPLQVLQFRGRDVRMALRGPRPPEDHTRCPRHDGNSSEARKNIHEFNGRWTQFRAEANGLASPSSTSFSRRFHASDL